MMPFALPRNVSISQILHLTRLPLRLPSKLSQTLTRTYGRGLPAGLALQNGQVEAELAHRLILVLLW